MGGVVLAFPDKRAPLTVEAVVSMNGGEGLVLNRGLKFLYEYEGQDLIGNDGPFWDVLRYERPVGRSKAFGGREFDIPLRNGGVVRASGQYWQAHISGHRGVPYGTIEQLRKCYVFMGGACVAPDAYAELRATYTGEVFGYWDYEEKLKREQVGSDV
jgi:hypothetical protein